MDATEFRVLTEAQGPGVVRVFHSAPAKGRVIVVMEKLKPAAFYPKSILSESYRELEIVALSTRRRKLLLELLRAVVALNGKGILWGDLRQENTGVDAEGHLRIFDFGSSAEYGDHNRAMDIVAFGKLVYNTLAGKNVLETSSITDAERRFTGLTSLAQSGLASALRECFRLGSQTSESVRTVGTAKDVRRVVRSFAEALGSPKAPQAGLFVFYDLVGSDATWTWPVMPEGWAHAGWGGSNNPRYPREELFVGPRDTLDEAERALRAKLAQLAQLSRSPIARFAVERTYNDQGLLS
jgi:serine/threonine protein kinase